MWENSKEYQSIGTLISRNRKLLKDEFERVAEKQKEVNFIKAKEALMVLLVQHFPNLQEEKLKAILRVAEVGGANNGLGDSYDFMKFLDVYKTRFAT